MFGLTSLVLGTATPVGAGSESAKEEVRVIASFTDLPREVQNAVSRFLANVDILEIEEAHAHKVTEFKVAYLRDKRLHELVWDATTNKLLGGSDPEVLKEVLAHLPQPARQAVLDRQGKDVISKLKIKHADFDDHEYIHVHFLNTDNGRKTDAKIEMNGSPVSKKS
ncbi:MAG: hypothetical protein WD425_17260 [Nitrospirales bacterium]